MKVISRADRHPWLLARLAVVLTFAVAALFGVVTVATASAAATLSTGSSSSAPSASAPEIRVGASTVASILAVGGHNSIAAGQRLGDRLSQSQMAVGRCVAAEDGSVAISFGHGARHLAGTGLSTGEVEGAIEGAIRSRLASAGSSGSFWGRVTVDGTVIEYRAYTLPDGTINVGTYYVP